METEKKKRIFVSFNRLDREEAIKIIHSIEIRGIEVYKDSDIEGNSHVLNQLQYLYEFSETVIVIISQNFYRSNFSELELEELIKIAKKRKISIIPVHIDNSPIPIYFINYQVIHLTKNYEKGIEAIIDKLKILPEIDFKSFSNSDFNQFAYDLLKEYGFKSITWHYSDHFDFGFDLMAEYQNKDPFGNIKLETWLIEIKFYSEDRYSINSINQLINSFNKTSGQNANILLITNSILTSITEDYLNNLKRKENIPITIVDGNALKKLVSKKKNLINRYFSR